MSTNSEVAQIFHEIAQVLEVTGANRFRVISYENAARVLRDLTTDVATLADDKKKLIAIDGIGDGTAKKIIEYVETGNVAEHQNLLKDFPRGLFDVLRISGLGPKTVKLLWEQAGVTDLDSLREAIDSGKLEGLPRMGAKTVENIRESIAFMQKASQRMRLGTALPIAEAIVERLSKVKGVSKLQYAGSLRRGSETIGDIDILASAKSPAALAKAFRAMPGVEKILGAGETKTSIRLDAGVQVDLRIVPDESFGAALMYFTGSKAHNIEMRERAIKKGLRLNEYGLFKADDLDDEEAPQKRGVKPVASKTEQEVYKALGVPWVPPEVRENAGEFGKTFDNLITIDDITSELHAHTKASDGHLTIDELAEEAKRRGFHTIAVTDHSTSSVQANGLDETKLRAHIKAIREARMRIKGIEILIGSEVDILNDGRLDYEDDLLAELDIVVASPHAVLAQDPKKATARLLKAIEHPLVHIIGHPTGRVIGKRDGLAPAMDDLIAAAVEHNTALEINANSMRLDLRDTHVRAAVEAGALLAINTDAHSVADFDQLRYGILTARRGWLTPMQCINTWTKTKLAKWLKSKR